MSSDSDSLNEQSLNEQSLNERNTAPDEPVGKNPIDQLVELLVYAPVGLAYEYEDVLPKLIKRGKSQVQLAKVLGQMAAQQGQDKAKQGSGIDDAVNDALGQAASVLARAITEFGQVIGLAPSVDTSDGTVDVEGVDPLQEDSPQEDSPQEDSPQETEDVEVPSVPPIAGYDSLKAREIVPLLGGLSQSQRERVRRYELMTRGRKTILGKLDKLDG